MFKKTQKYLLINNPLLWNTKVVPLACFLIGVHIIFFIIGFVSGKLDFTETERDYHYKDTEIMMFFSILISILTIIVWLIFYFKNNGFKSYYPKSNLSLFKEWSILLFISFLLCTLHFSYLNGYDIRVRSYFSEEETIKRCQTISKASILYGDNYDAAFTKDSTVNDTLRQIRLDYVVFNKKKYSLESLINKDNENFSFFDSKWDSLTKIKVKNWLIEDNKDSVRVLMKDYFKLINEHKLISNIDENKWFSIVYNPPTFIQNKIVAKREMVFFNENYNDYNEYESQVYVEPNVNEIGYDTINQYIKIENKVKYVYNRTYIPADNLEFNYQKIATAYTNPSVSSKSIMVALYFAFGLSIILFSFRVSSGRNWLIALISMGIFNVLLGIITAMRSTEISYLVGILILTIFLALYFAVILFRNTKKGISAIMLNGLLWLLLSFVPIIYNLLLELLKRIHGYNRYDYNYREHPSIVMMKENMETMAWLNLLFVALIMLLLSFKIKKWKGIPES